MQRLTSVLLQLLISSFVLGKITRDAVGQQRGNNITIGQFPTTNLSSNTNQSFDLYDYLELMNRTFQSETANSSDGGEELSGLNKKYAAALKKKLIDDTWNTIVNLKSRADNLAYIGVNLKSDNRVKRVADESLNRRPITLSDPSKRSSVDRIVSEESKDDSSKKIAEEDLISAKFLVSAGEDLREWEGRDKRRTRYRKTKVTTTPPTTTSTESISPTKETTTD